MKGYTELAELLCKAGADINATAQQFSVESSAGVNMTTQTTTTITHTATSLASANKHPDTVAMLQKYGGHGFAK